jgi:hypothetical protein
MRWQRARVDADVSTFKLRLEQHGFNLPQYAGSTLNPYLTVILTFLATLAKHRDVLMLHESSVEMAGVLSSVPRKVMI